MTNIYNRAYRNLISRSGLFFILFILLLTSCSQSLTAGNSTASSQASQATRPAVRILVLENLNLASPALENPTEITIPSLTPTQTQPPPTYVAPTRVVSNPTVQGCINKAEFVLHASISINTAIKPGELFGKVWRIKNNGTCTWTTGYALTFASGDIMQAPKMIPLPHSVAPGETIDIRANMVAPEEANTYAGYWLLRDELGNLFGTGESSDQPLIIQIVVLAKPHNSAPT